MTDEEYEGLCAEHRWNDQGDCFSDDEDECQTMRQVMDLLIVRAEQVDFNELCQMANVRTGLREWFCRIISRMVEEGHIQTATRPTNPRASKEYFWMVDAPPSLDREAVTEWLEK